MAALTLVSSAAPAAPVPPTAPALPPLHRRLVLAAKCAARVLQTGRTWQHDRLDGYREGVTAGINRVDALLQAGYAIDAVPADRPNLTLVGGAS